MLRIPLLTYILYGRSPIDWKFETVPQKASSFGLNNNVRTEGRFTIKQMHV
jgi:hypothetical protein